MLCCLRGGLIAGFAAAALRLPGRLYFRARRGRRAGLPAVVGFAALDVLAAALAALILASTLVYANGGELRMYAVCAFLAGAAIPTWAVRELTEERRIRLKTENLRLKNEK